MKFSTYTPSVNPNTLHNIGITPTQASRDLNAYGGRGGGEQLGALANAAKMGLALQQKVADGKALEANAEYNRLMSEGTSALMQKKEGEALTIAEDYDKMQKKVLAQVNKKYGGYLYGDARESFNAYTMRDDATRRAGVVKYQTAQTDAYRETQYNNQLAECRNAAIEGGGNIEAVGGALNRMDAVVESRFGEYGGEKLVEQKRIAAGQIVGDAVNMAINSGDYAKAESLLSTYKGMLPTNAYIDAKTKLHKQQEARREYIAVDDITAQCRDVNGKIDLNRAREMVDALCGRNAIKSGVENSGEYWDSLIGVETPYGRNGCVYASVTLNAPYFRFAAEHKNETNVGSLFRAAKEEGSGAHVEKYTGQQANKGDILVYVQPGDDPTDPENLEHVMVSDGIGGTYGNSSGAADYVDENGNEIRGNGYIVHNTTQDVGNLDIAYIIRMDDRADSAVSAYNPEKQEKMMRMIEAKAKSEDALQRQNESAAYDNLLQQMQNAGDYENAYNMAINSGLPMPMVNRAVNAAASYYGVRRTGAGRGGAGSASEESAETPMWNGKAYNPTKDYQKARTLAIKLQNGQNPTAKEWVDIEDAADAIVGSGILTEEQVAELSDVYAGAMPIIADELDSGHTIPEIYDELIQAGTSPMIAIIAIANVNSAYKKIGKVTPYEPDKGESGGTGGGY